MPARTERSRSMIREHAPLLAETLDDIGPAAWLLTAVTGSGGNELKGIARHWGHQAGAANMPAIRYDWFEQVGMTDSLGIGQDKVSTFESKEGVVDVNPIYAPGHFFVSYNTVTLPDMEEALTRIISMDPAGKGRTIGMTAWNRDGRPCYHQSWGIHCQAYGVSAEQWWVHSDADGSGVIFHVAPGVRDALRDLQRWWRKGLLDPETPTVDRPTMNAKLETGFVALSNRYRMTCLNENTLESGGGQTCSAYRANPESKWLRFHAITAPDGTYGSRHENKALPLSDPGEWFVIKHDVSDDKLARILQLYDWANFNCEGRILTQYGVDGVHYTREDGNICAPDGTEFARDGFIKVTATGADQADVNTLGLNYYNHTSFPLRVYGYEGRNPTWPVPEYQAWDQCHRPGGPCTENLIRMYKEDVFKETRFDELTSQYRGPLEAIHGEFFYKMIISDVDVDDVWDDYVSEWLAAGGLALHDELAKLDYTVADLMAGTVER